MTIEYSTLRENTTTGNRDYLLERLPQTEPSTSVFDEADVIYRPASDLQGVSRGMRRRVHLLELETKTKQHARTAPVQALEQLSDHGFAWRDVARIVGVSVPAINKWRKGTGITGENRLKIARMLALIDMLETRFVDEPASWLEMPVQEGASSTRLDLLARGRYDLVLQLASTHTGDSSVESVLDEIDQNWRQTMVDNRFETFVADDGMVSIRLKR